MKYLFLSLILCFSACLSKPEKPKEAKKPDVMVCIVGGQLMELDPSKPNVDLSFPGQVVLHLATADVVLSRTMCTEAYNK